MSVAITRAKDTHGDMVFHMATCRDLDNPRHTDQGEPAERYEAETLLDAILAADIDMADWFGQEPYEDSGEMTWNVSRCSLAPCIQSQITKAKIKFGHQGQPSIG